ncbi:arsenic metallochaperone ArsD family protein [Kocuria sp. TGY1127_2]|uniref:arsenic metallochaperone ArsD family protein n=1 Tax=Kocuria sp. TGY1127_2 TaxID=2711328 RepID=UPI001FAB99C6|nr:arsenic metallochaperone ArsD family protein [Kocuria sp. TGY1127_2]
MSDLTEVEVFIPAGGPEDTEREEFLDAAAELAEQGYPITVYVRGEDEWAFEECEHVADMLEASGDMVLPITLLGPQIVASWMYPTSEQMRRFAKAQEPKRKDPRFSAAAAACGPGGRQVPGSGQPSEKPAPAGFAAVLAGVPETPRGGPDMGARRNLMGGDIGEGVPPSSTTADSTGDEQASGGCCGGSCGCGGH